MKRRIMIQGTMSAAGKSLLCTALCRIFREDGFKVTPFKSQNMSRNGFVTIEGLELSRAQAVQAEAAKVPADVRMNPVMLKPSDDTGSEVIVNGTSRGLMRAAEYFAYKQELVPEILAAYRSLEEENDIIVIEGAGSPAEINLRENDIVNMGLAHMVNAPVLLCGDIDRGGVFAQLYGTCALLEEADRTRIRGLVINKFRGDAALLRPGLKKIETLTKVPVIGVVPYLDVLIEEEDSLSERLRSELHGRQRDGDNGKPAEKFSGTDSAKDWNTASARTFRETQYDKLAEGVRKALDMDTVYRIMEEYDGDS